MRRRRHATGWIAFLLAIGVLAPAFSPATGGTPGGVGFELKGATVSPKHPLFAGKRKIRLHYAFAADRPVDLRIRVIRLRGGRSVRSWRERSAKPGKRLERAWNGLNRRGRAVPDGRYEFRVGPVGADDRYAARLHLRGHVFPVDGPHGTRGAIGEFHAPRSGGRTHEGFDITADCGTPLVAARGGTVQRAGYDPSLYGNYVLVDAAKSRQDLFYAHMTQPSAAGEGERVFTNEFLGTVGQTGNAQGTPCHLHFEIHVGGEPIDPEPALRRWDR
jgi:murein DD-endopeptidase MepM/ murein hydrolase activator NlpD